MSDKPSMIRLMAAVASIALLLAPSEGRAQSFTEAWSSGFETGFPGDEWLDYDNGSWSPDGSEPSDRTEAWTILEPGDPPGVVEGDHVYKGWIWGERGDGSHRAYPGIHVDIASPLVNVFWVWLDVDYDAMEDGDWVHFATWANNADWDVHTMSVRRRRLEMAHLDWSYIGPSPQPDFPLRRWVRLTAYIHYDGAEGYVRVWQDGEPVLEGTYTSRSGTRLLRAHWGMYANGGMDHGVQYNDDIRIWTLDAPLDDLETEPLPASYDVTPGEPGTDGGIGGGEDAGMGDADGGFVTDDAGAGIVDAGTGSDPDAGTDPDRGDRDGGRTRTDAAGPGADGERDGTREATGGCSSASVPSDSALGFPVLGLVLALLLAAGRRRGVTGRAGSTRARASRPRR